MNACCCVDRLLLCRSPAASRLTFSSTVLRVPEIPDSSLAANTQMAIERFRRSIAIITGVANPDLVLESTTPNPAKKGLKYWCQDETRLGLKTIERKKITAVGVKPIGKVQWNFKAYYLYGAVAPQTGESFWLEFSHLDGLCFQVF